MCTVTGAGTAVQADRTEARALAPTIRVERVLRDG